MVNKVTTGITIGKEVEVEFVPKLGQTDYTNIKYAPVVNCVLAHEGKILLIQRSQRMRFYPGYWGGISGFLDDYSGVSEKVKHEIKEEAGIEKNRIVKISEGAVVEQPEPAYKKVWVIHPVRVDISTEEIKLDWEGQDYAWVAPDEANGYNLLPGFGKVISALFPDQL
ncbi:MAG: NUDIX domain-containing protein [bacterium]|nr:NUDIX domain-containing protein [bacterium]